MMHKPEPPAVQHSQGAVGPPETDPDGTQEPALGWSKRLLFWSSLVLLIIIFAVCLGEVALRVLYHEQELHGNYWGMGAFEADEACGYRHAAGFRGNMYRRDNFDIPVRIAANNLRQSDFESQMKYPNRILILGDSIPFGIGVEERAVFPTLIERRLNAKGIGVINGAQAGYCVEQEARFGIRLAEDVEPDILLLCIFPENDVRADYYKSYEKFDIKWGSRLRRSRELPIAPVDFLRTHSYTWMLVADRVHRSSDRVTNRAAEFRELAQADPRQVIRPTLEAVASIHDYCRSNDIVFGVMMVPSMGGERVFYRPLRARLYEQDIPVLDLTGAGFIREDHLLTDGHWSERGHARAAQQVGPFCLDLMSNSLNDRAWLLLTADRPGPGDGDRALALALEAVEFGDGQNPSHLDTLALAQASTGRADQAVQTQAKALELLPATDSSRRQDYEARLAEYRQAARSGAPRTGTLPLDGGGAGPP